MTAGWTQATALRGLPPRARKRSTPTFWAVLASTAVHAAVLGPLAFGAAGLAAVQREAPGLRVTLSRPADAISAVPAVPATPIEPTAEASPREPDPLPATVETASAPLPASHPAAVAQRAPRPPGRGDDADIAVEGRSLLAMSRLGDEIVSRAAQQFPVEIDWPVRVYGKIEAKYPASALAAGVEGSVVAWVLVDAQGIVQEIRIVEGPDALAEAVTTAIKAAQFHPAALDGVGITYPIALEFTFALDSPAASLAAASPTSR